MKINQLIMASALLFSPLSAQALDVGVGVKGGTAGVGVDLSFVITPTVNVRVSSTSYDFGSSSENLDLNSGDGQTIANITADLDTDFGASGILFDWYIFDGTFHVTAGMVKNDSTLSINGSLNAGDSVTFGGTAYDVNSMFSDPSVGGSVDFGDAYEPYVGIGWGRKAATESGLSLSVELGVMLLDPKVNLTAPQLSAAGLAALSAGSGGAKTTQADFEGDVDTAETEANSELSDLEMWPVFSIGLNYAF